MVDKEMKNTYILRACAWLQKQVVVDRQLIEKATVVILIATHIFYICTQSGVFLRSIEAYGILWFIRWYLPKLLPFTIFLIYLAVNSFSCRLLKVFGECFSWLGFYSSSVVFGVLIFGFAVGLPTNYFVGDVFVWSYAALIEWNLAFVLGFLLMYKKSLDPVLSVTFATLLISAGGMIYELPIYHILPFSHGVWTDISYPLIIATKWFSLGFIIYLLQKYRWKPTKIFWVALTAYVIHGLWYAEHWSQAAGYCPAEWIGYGAWLPRIFGIVLLLALPSGMKIEKRARAI